MYGARAFYRDWLGVFHAEMLRTLPIAVYRVIKIQCVVGVSPVGFYPESCRLRIMTGLKTPVS